MAESSPLDKPILVRLTFFLCLLLTLGIVFIFAVDQFLLQTRKFLSPLYLLALLSPDILLLAVLYRLASLDKGRCREELFRKQDSKRKYLFYGVICALYLSGLITYLAYLPKPDILILQTGILILGLLGMTVFVYSEFDWSKVYLLITTIIITIVLLEVTSRLLLGSAKLFRIYAQWGAGAFNESQFTYLDYGDVNTPPTHELFREGGELLPSLDVWVVGKSQEERVRFVTNSKGFRNQLEFSYDPPPNTYRILYIGDSFVAGYRVDQNLTSAKMIEDKLNELSETSPKPHKIEVLAVTIGEPAAAWLWLEEYGFKYQPDLIILGLTLGNDIYQTYIATDPNNYLEVTDHQIVQKGLPTLGLRTPPLNQLYLPSDAFLFGPEENPAPNFFWRTVYRLKAKFSWTSLGVLINRATGNPVAIASWYQDTFPGQVYAFDPINGLGLFYKPPLSQVEEGFLRLEKVLQGLKARAQEQKSSFALIFFPQRFQVTESDWESAEQRYALNPTYFDLDYPNRRLNETCIRNNIMCLDLLDKFRSEAILNPEPLYLPLGDMHWNSEGQKIAGITIANFIWREFLAANSQ